MQLTDFKVLSFACYGTLIDWETGICKALAPLAGRTGKAFPREQRLEAHARHSAAQEALTPGRPYPDLLQRVHERIAREWGVIPDPLESRAYGQSVKAWPAFEEVPAALRYLKSHFQLVILSDLDRDSLAASQAKLQVEFDLIFTAREIGSTKPDPRNFEYLVRHLGQAGIQQHEILHTAESLFRDHLPANQLGLASAWLQRRSAPTAHGATLPHCDFTFTSLEAMAQAHRDALSCLRHRE